MSTTVTLRVQELRDALAKRGLETSGLKAELEQRLEKALQADVHLHERLLKTMRKKKRKSEEVECAVDLTHENEPLTKQLECPVCFDLITPPIFQCSGGHLLCNPCRGKLPRPKRCPECRTQLGHVRCLALEQLAQTLEVPCPNKDAGCACVVPYTKLAEHKTVCEFAHIRCPVRGCQWQGCFLNLKAHFAGTAGHQCESVNAAPPTTARAVGDRVKLCRDCAPTDEQYVEFPVRVKKLRPLQIAWRTADEDKPMNVTIRDLDGFVVRDIAPEPIYSSTFSVKLDEPHHYKYCSTSMLVEVKLGSGSSDDPSRGGGGGSSSSSSSSSGGQQQQRMQQFLFFLRGVPELSQMQATVLYVGRERDRRERRWALELGGNVFDAGVDPSLSRGAYCGGGAALPCSVLREDFSLLNHATFVVPFKFVPPCLTRRDQDEGIVLGFKLTLY